MSNAHSERHKALQAAVRHERELREAEKASFDHERELRAVFDQHERELRLQAEFAVEKARDIQFHEYERRLEGMNEFREQLQRQASTFMTVERFEREHSWLLTKQLDDIAMLTEKISGEQHVTTRQDAQRELLDTLAVNRRWLIGLGVTVALFGATTLLHAFGVI